MLRKLLQTQNDYAALLVRLGLGLVMFPHGAQKALGWFGGPGIGGTIEGFRSMGIPPFFGALAIIAEFLGSIGLIVGLLGRVAAFGIGCVMVVAALGVSLPNGFFMNWAGNLKGEGYEYHLLALAMVLATMVRGSGAWSLDYLLSRRGSEGPVATGETQAHAPAHVA